ncbi:MAG: histidinol phosphate phosphatase [Gammaproteobacteria bacterium]|nr:histidinol phosphate phosphatase [Gammaproteobacteria bacterium]MYJ53250.1 histidinol phosphate phosphatase [Gammaproteobacteria bacterium]
MDTNPNLQYLETAHCVADSARNIARQWFRRSFDIRIKADGSPVTTADVEVESAARSVILERHPEHRFFGEETGHSGRSREWMWIVDPIDGTRSFVTGKPTFGTLIALLHRGVPIIGIIDQAVLDERWVGIAGSPTTLNGNPCSTSRIPRLCKARLCITTPDMFDSIQKEKVNALSERCSFRTFGGDCYNYGLLASGYSDLICEADLKPYDYCAMVPIIEGAGGTITDWQGKALGVDSSGEVVAAASRTLHEEALSVLNRQ